MMAFNRGTNGHLEVAENIVGFLHEDKFTDVIIEARADTDEGLVYINAHQVGNREKAVCQVGNFLPVTGRLGLELSATEEGPQRTS